MSYATLMVWVSSDHVSKQLIGAATGLAEKFDARLIGLSAVAVVPPFVAEGVVIVDNATEFDIEKMKASLAEAGKKFRSAAGRAHKIEWRSMIDFPTQTLVAEARCADLILVEKQSQMDIYRQVDVGAAILGAGRPILVVPKTVKAFTADNIVIGWKDTREARRAVQDALPILRRAKRVTVVELCDNSQIDAARSRVEDVMHYLAGHRVNAERLVEILVPGSVADQFLSFAADEGADLLVIGAYGHNRFSEWVFGGMTRGLLESSPICCLMSH